MSLSNELVIHNLLYEALFYHAHQDEHQSNKRFSQDSVDSAYKLLKNNVRDSFMNFSFETIIFFSETAIKIEGRVHLANEFINLFFQRNTSQGQIYIRALLVKAKLTANQAQEELLKADEMIKSLKNALGYVSKALEIISNPKNKQKYAFLIYNSSVCVYHIIRESLRSNLAWNFYDIVERIEKLLNEADEPDFNWRCRFTLLLFFCLYDMDKKKEAFAAFERLWASTKIKGDCEFQDSLLRLRIHYGLNSFNKKKLNNNI